MARSMDIVRLLFAADSFPFVESIGRNEAPSSSQWHAERPLCGDSFSSRVNHAGADRHVLRPAGNQSPAAKVPCSIGTVAALANQGYRLRWADVETRFPNG